MGCGLESNFIVFKQRSVVCGQWSVNFKTSKIKGIRNFRLKDTMDVQLILLFISRFYWF